ncbi:MAG TPA: histidine kinase [Bacteroidia bacterium]
MAICSPFAAHAQYGLPIHYTQDNGLSSESIYSCIIDKSRFVWFASETGAFRFNGHEFEHFKAIESAANSFLYFKVDSKNRLWVNTIGDDINYFENGSWHASEYNKIIKSKAKSNLGSILIGTIESIVIFKYEKSILLAYDEDSKIKYKYFENILDTANAEIMFYMIQDNRLKFITSIGNAEIDLNFIKQRQKNTPDIGYYFKNTQKKQALFYKKEHLYHVSLLPDRPVDGELYFHESTLYLAGPKGLFRYNRINDTLFKQEQEPLSNIPCVSMAIDENKNLWVCTQLDGVYFYPYLLGTSNVDSSLKGDFFLKALPSKNSYKVLTRYGKVVNCKNNKFSVEQNFNTLSYDFQIFKGDEYYLTSNTLFKNDKRFFKNHNSWFKSLLIDPDSEEMLIGTGSGLLKIWPKAENLDSTVLANRIYGMAWHQNNILLGTDNGAFLFKNKKREPFYLGPYSTLKNILSIIQSSDSILFFLSRNFGVLIKDKDEYLLLKENIDLLGAPNCLFSPRPGIILIGSRNGLNVVHYKQHPLTIQHIKSFTNKSGLIDNKINNIAFDKNDTQLLITYNNAIQTFSLNSILSKKQNTKLYFKYINSENHTYNFFENLKFKHFENNIEIGFDVIDYALENRKGFSYRLIGVSSKWNLVNGNSIKFSDLNPGNYVFELKLQNQYNTDNDVISIKFEVVPAYWQTLWFRIIAMLVIASIILWIFTVRHRKIINRERDKNNLEKEHALLELEAIKAQVNPHFIYNCLNSIKLSIVKDDNKGAEKQLSTFSKLVRETLDYSKTDFISLTKEIIYLDKYLQMEKLRFKEKLEYQIISNISDKESTLIPCLLIQPFVENAVKHGLSKNGSDTSTIKIQFELKDNKIECKVEDSGCGIDTRILNKKNLPSGLGLSKKRAKIYNSIYNMDIQIKIINKNTLDQNESGTLATIILPYNTKQPNESIYR